MASEIVKQLVVAIERMSKATTWVEARDGAMYAITDLMYHHRADAAERERVNELLRVLRGILKEGPTTCIIDALLPPAPAAERDAEPPPPRGGERDWADEEAAKIMGIDDTIAPVAVVTWHYDGAVPPTEYRRRSAAISLRNTIAAALRRAAARQRPEDERIHDIAHEAHTMGRLYADSGEKLKPCDEFNRVRQMVTRFLGHKAGESA